MASGLKVRGPPTRALSAYAPDDRDDGSFDSDASWPYPDLNNAGLNCNGLSVATFLGQAFESL